MNLSSLPLWARNLLLALAFALGVVLAGGTVALVADEDGDGPAPARTVPIVKVQPADPGPPITAPAKQVEKLTDQLEELNRPALEHEDLRGAPLTDAQKDANEKVAERAGVTGLSPLLQFGASFEQRGCRTIPQGTNFSSRPAGVKPTLIGAAHIWVMPEREGWGDVLAVRDFLARLGTGASSHFIVDGEGNCGYTVPESSKAWTSGNMNPFTACNIEMGGMPDNNGWMKPAGMAKAALIFRDCAHRWGIPIQLGNTRGCTVVRAGLVDHNELTCGNVHWDICSTAEKARTSDSDSCPLVLKILRAMKAGEPVLTTFELKLVRSVRHPAGTGHSRLYWRRRLGAQIVWLGRSPHQPRQAHRLRILKRVWVESLR